MALHSSNPQTSFDAREPDHAFALAVEVMRERFSRLSRADRDDLFELLPDMLGGDKEARESAWRTVNEILAGADDYVQRMNLADDSTDGLTKWLKYFSGKLKEARTQANLTQAELAEAAGLPQSHISRLENGMHSPSEKTRCLLAKALKKPAGFFDPILSAEDEAPPKVRPSTRNGSKKPTSQERRR